MRCRNHSVPKFSLLRPHSEPSGERVPNRTVRFTEQFFDRLYWLLPEQRGADGTPSVTDFLLHDLPQVRDLLAEDFRRYTMQSDTADVRVFLGKGAMVPRYAIYASLVNEDVEAFWLTIEGHADPAWGEDLD
jgi:hypothetical protein